MSNNDEPVEVCMLLVAETEKAILVTDDVKDANGQRKEHWLPKSKIEYHKIGDSTVEVSIPQWLIDKNGIEV